MQLFHKPCALITDGSLRPLPPQVPHEWREDPRWRGAAGGGSRQQPAHRADYPSRWLPAAPEQAPAHAAAAGSDEDEPAGALKVIDFLEVPRRRAWC